ncbi:MAG TPA: RNA methyltransferase [Roseiflexaceae bacterium]|nr:RNA methyltransferase [Roseiflexaceae bacterium]HMP39933.1 RNA methyltransferase [Roseiflexaceae bacterium]
MTEISSLQNMRIKQIRALRQRKEREASGRFFIEGLQLVSAAVTAGVIEQLVVAPTILRSAHGRRLIAQAHGIPILHVTKEILCVLAGRDNIQGLGAVVRQQWAPLPHPGSRCWIVLEGIQYPGNLGTILRTADAIDAAGVILVGPSADPYDPAAVRASTGAIFSRSLVRCSLAELTRWQKHHGLSLIGATPDGAIDFRAAAYHAPLALVFGSEGAGITPELRASCTTTVHIPMAGRCDSLNLAIAASLVLYEVFRRQPGDANAKVQ